MKKGYLVGLAIGIFLIGNFGVANALYLSNGTDVGGYDDFWASTVNMIPSEQNELNWINSVTGNLYSTLTKTDTIPIDWSPVFTNNDGTGPVIGGYAFELPTYQPEWWLIKTGNLTPRQGNKQVHYLFRNLASLDWAVLNLSSDEYLTNLSGVGQISHVSEVGSAPVPEPTTMLLFGTGLLGLAAVGRRRR